MSEFFWMPVQDTSTRPLTDPLVKRLGKQLYKLYGRCSICDWSGPSELFTEIQSGEQYALVCSGRDCGGSEHTWRHLLMDGWSPLSSFPKGRLAGLLKCTCADGRGCERHTTPYAF